MNVDKMTERVREALSDAFGRALRERNPNVEPEHILAALLDQDGGVAPALLQKAGVDDAAFRAQVADALAKLPRLSGSNAVQPQLSGRGTRVLVQAADEAAKLTDEYVSVEHLLLAMLDDAGGVGRLLRDGGVTRDKLLGALRDVRGNQRVTSQNPEGTYQSLERYGQRSNARGAKRANSIPSSGAMTRSAASFKCSRAARKTIRCSSANPASARPRSSKVSRSASCAATFPKASKTSASSRSIWAR